MLFITNRKLLNINGQEIYPRSISFDLETNASTNEVYFCARDDYGQYQELGSRWFFEEIRSTPYEQILLYIHGYSNQPEDDIFTNTLLLQQYFNVKQLHKILVIPIIWPCDNDLGIIKDYWDDQISADMSGYSIQRALSFFYFRQNQDEHKCYKFINVLAHSMGNRVLRQSLNCWKKYTTSYSIPKIFRNTFMVAPDIVNESLEYGNSGEAICLSSRNVIVYHANDDLALRASKIANLKNNIASRRLGHSGPEDLINTPKNVFTVDCDNVNNNYDFPKGHTYFLPNTDSDENNKVLEHIYRMLENGRFFEDNGTKNLVL